jgi:hypothetical protein
VITLDDLEVVLSGDTVTLPLMMPVRRGQVDVWLSRTKGGMPARGALVRTIVVRDAWPPFTLYSRDLTAEWPKGGRAFLVVAYANQVLATGAVKVVR